MKKNRITSDQLEALALGAAVLGSGGGGDPHYFKLMTQYLLDQNGPIDLISIDMLTSDDLVVPISCVGAPLVTIEKLLSEQTFIKIFDEIKRIKNKKPTVIMPAEIGGANAFTPLIAASILGLPVLDADLMGRAFPELQMCSPSLDNMPIAPVIMADALGNSEIIESNDSFIVEALARDTSVKMGSSAVAAMYMMTKEKVARNVVPDSISQAIAIGDTLIQSRVKKTEPIQSLLKHMNGVVLASGTITDINQEIKAGFLQGSVTITNTMQRYFVHYQNENLIVSTNSSIAACTPDIIILLEQETGAPITTESLSYGLAVSIVIFAAPAIWQTPQGLRLVGPRRFGYDIDYTPIIS